MFEQKVYLFLSVVETGSFSGAAKKHYISQSAVSQSINKLESDLDVKLFDRNSYRPKLTVAGKYYYDALSKLVKDYEVISKNVRSLSSSENRIIIGITNNFEKYHVQKIVKKFKETHNVKISVKRCNPSDSLPLLQSKKFHVSLGMDVDFDNVGDIIKTPLYIFHVCVISSLSNPISKYKEVSPDMLHDQDVILLNTIINQKTYESFMNSFKLDGFIPNIVKQCDDIDDFLFSISLNEGIGYSAEELIQDDEDIVKIPLIHSHHESKMSMAYNKDEDNDVVLELIEMINDYFKELSKDYKCSL